MQSIKYYYEGKPIKEYAIEHGYNPETIRTRIWKKRHDPKYNHLTDQEIIDMVIKKCGTRIKYMYGGMTLRQYCQKNDLVFGTILSRINNLKEKDESLSDDDAVRKAIEEFTNHNYTLYFQGEPLKEYCLKNPDINYNTLRNYIARMKEKDDSLSTDDIIIEYLKKEHFGVYRYYYLGIPLVTYCEEKNISYKAVLGRIFRFNKKNDMSLSDDEIVAMIMDKYEPFMPKYMYKGETLSNFCKNNNISYYSVVSYVKRKKEKDETLDVDFLIDEAIKTIKRQGIIYYYQGIPLRDYCILNNLNASSIRSSILRKKSNSNLPLQEIVNLCVETYSEAKIKYFYHGESLYSFCKRTKINYNTIISRYLDLNCDLDEEEKNKRLEEIVEDVINNPRVRTKYYFYQESLRQYAFRHNYSYNAIYQRIKKYRNEFTYSLDSMIVQEAVLTYEEKNVIKRNRLYFESLEELEKLDLKQICLEVCLDYESLLDMINMGFDIKQAIMILWFLGDKADEKAINDEIILMICNVDTLYLENKLDIYLLYVLYKTRIMDTSEKIIDYYKDFIEEIIDKYRLYYKDLSENEIKELKEELDSFILMLIDYIYLDDKNSFNKHMMYLIGEKIRKYYEMVTLGYNDKKYKKSPF